MTYEDYLFVINFVNKAISECAGWFIDLLSVSRMEQTYLSWIFVMLVGRFFLMPILGAGMSQLGSDTVKRIRGTKTNNSSKEK